MVKNKTGISLIQRANMHRSRTAVMAQEGSFTYGQLLKDSARIASGLLKNKIGDKHSGDLNETRVAFLTPPGYHYAAIQWGIWRAGGIAVPLCALHPRTELEYVIKDSDADIIIAHPDFKEILIPVAETLNRWFLLPADMLNTTDGMDLPEIDKNRRAMILYTSGTTGKPKGVVTTHSNIEAQVTSLITAWGWTADDHILHVLPLHHVHGIINVLTCALWAGAVCEILPKFDAQAVWNRFTKGNLTLFMAVPTIYSKLVAYWEAVAPEQQKIMSEACKGLRLMVSGSAAMPVSVLEKWRTISGHVLLERYGMTEIGMALSNPLHGERMPGYVGMPLPGIDVRLVDETGTVIEAGGPGEIQVRSPGVFFEYWRKPEATQSEFDGEWFRTGDVATIENGVYRILGRKSVDIIKTGGYKVSALEIEEALRTNPCIKDCAVVGVKNDEWGEQVSAAIIPAENEKMTLKQLRSWAKERIAAYKIPARMLMLDDLPLNSMGKVSKLDVIKLFEKND